MNINDVSVLSTVAFTDADGEFQNGIVVLVEKGWISIETEEGEIIKKRAKDIELAEYDEELEDEELEDENGVLTMSKKLRKYAVNYTKATKGVNRTKHCGDGIAQILNDKVENVAHLYKATSKLTGVPEADLKSRYGHLNQGQQRMNLGNRIRAAFKDELITLADVSKAVSATAGTK